MIFPNFPLAQKVNTTYIHNNQAWMKLDTIN